MAVEIVDYRIYVDTNIITFYPFLERPDSFLPGQRENPYKFTILLPVVRELERIKDEHFSKGQRERARALLDKLEEAERSQGVLLTPKCLLDFRADEPNEAQIHGDNINRNSPDDQFIAAAFWVRKYSSFPCAVLSDDVGVRVRAKHQLHDCHVYAPDPKLRFEPEQSINLPQLMKATIKELARELAELMREHER